MRRIPGCLLLPALLLLPAGSVFCVSLPDGGAPLSEAVSITVPPGGYAWQPRTGENCTVDFSVVPTLAPGPWPSLRAFLPPAADSALEACGEWLRDDLQVRFSDLLYEDFSAGVPVVPRFGDVNGDGYHDLLVTGLDGSLIAALAFPRWEAIDISGWTGEAAGYSDVTGDGIPDSVFVTEGGVLIVHSRGEPVVSAAGFGGHSITGTALFDLEGDGLSDLVLGTEEGGILVYRNTGTDLLPCFVPAVSCSRRALPMNPGAFSCPAVITSGDSTIVLAVGTQENGLRIYSASRSRGLQHISWIDTCVTVDGRGLLNLTPSTAEVDGETMLFCGTREGALYRYMPGGDSLSLLDLPPVPGSYPGICTFMMDDDELPDLVAGTMEGQVYWLQGREGWFHGSWREVEGIPPIPSGAPAPWDDGLVFGTETGDVRFFSRDVNGRWHDATGSSPFRDLYAGDFSTPAFADLDSDGVPELITGSSRGNLTLFRLNSDACQQGPLFLESFSWSLQPGSGAPDIGSYYSRYYPPWTVLRVPAGAEAVTACAEEVLKAEPEHRDEVAYCIANTPTGTLRTMYSRGDLDLFRLNARAVYRMADALAYAALEDSGGMSRLRLRTGKGWFDVRPDDYYRFVVHPMILFEAPARVNAEYWSLPRDTTELTLEEWLNIEPEDLYGSGADHAFWRDLLPADGSGGKPLLESMEQASTYEEAVIRLCNFQSHSQPGGHMSFGYATNDLQPMVIYRKAYGSCGEQSILQTALCRTFLIPAYVVGCRGEDHQWAHYLHPASGRWDHWDINYGLEGIGGIWVSGEGVDHRGKTISTVTAFGPGNTVWPVTGSVIASPGSGYMPGDSGYTRTASVEVTVTDPAGSPVEGAMVLARSHWENANSVSVFEYTDDSGKCSFQLGREPLGGYTFDVVSHFGAAGAGNISFQEDMDYRVGFTVPCVMPRPQITEVPDRASPVDSGATAFQFPVSYFSGSLYSPGSESGTGVSSRDWAYWSRSPRPGMVLYMDGNNFRRYRGGHNCRALHFPFEPPPGDTCYAVLDNRNSKFTWLEFHLDRLVPSAGEECTPPDISWLDGPTRDRTALAGPCPAPGSIRGDGDGSGWIFTSGELPIDQDDPADPLTAGTVVGPFRVPPGERSLGIGTFGGTPGMDVDLFLFMDSNGNLQVDGMEEMFLASTTPASSERIDMAPVDTNAVFWIYLHGWQVSGGTGTVELGLSFTPELIPLHSLHPTGHVRRLPEGFSFKVAEDRQRTVFLLLAAGGDTLPVSGVDGRWSVSTDLLTEEFITGEVEVHAEDMQYIGSIEWGVMVDSLAPELLSAIVSVDSAGMTGTVEARCIDAHSGMESVTVHADTMPGVPCSLSDSVWTCVLDLSSRAAGPVDLTICFRDSAGNESMEHRRLNVPEPPPVLFSSVHPRGDVYDHRPVLQVSAGFRYPAPGWTASAVLRSSTGSFLLELEPIVIDGDLIQFWPGEMLEDDDYSAAVRIRDGQGSVLGETVWAFQVRTMESTR